MKKKVLILIAVIAILVTTLSGCNVSKEASPSFKLDLDYQYDEVGFINSMAQVKENNVNLFQDGVSEFEVVYPSELDNLPLNDKGEYEYSQRYQVELKRAIPYFVNTIEKITGQKLSSSPTAKGSKVIEFKLIAEDKQLANDQGYYLNISQNKITIGALGYQGISNGLYSFLENELGCMFLSSSYDYIPSMKTINLQAKEIRSNPSFAWRNLYANKATRNDAEFFKENPENYNDWHSKLKLNGTAIDNWGTFVHTFYTFIPPEEYFESNPEYFALYKGKRRVKQGPVDSQLCLTNENVYKILSEKLWKMMEEKPNVQLWDVSQMDTWASRGTGCECKDCKALDDKYNSPQGSILTFINRLADECKEKFPNNYISTLAYNYSVKVPTGIAPRDNVIIKLCFMPGDNASDYANPRNEEAQKHSENLAAWGKIAKNILIWDYNVPFQDALMPYPLLSPMKANHDFYYKNNVYGFFHQMNIDEGNENEELNSYLFSRIMWDKDVDIIALAQKYLYIYYGNAYKSIASYNNLLSENLYASNTNLDIYTRSERHSTTFLSNSQIDDYLALFAQAELAVKDDPIMLERVKFAKINVLYAKANVPTLADAKGRKAALDELVVLCEKAGITEIREFHNDGTLAKKVKVLDTQIASIPYIITLIVVVPLGIVALVVLLIYKKKKKASKQ